MTDARSNVLHARLVCCKSCNAALKSFAAVLGERRFRYSQTGTEDL
jgi:hypothetical protein